MAHTDKMCERNFMKKLRECIKANISTEKIVSVLVINNCLRANFKSVPCE